MSWTQRLQRWLVPCPGGGARVRPVAAGLYHFQRERDGRYWRFHLRVERGGQGLLIAAAAEAVRLSPAGTVAAHGLLSGRAATDVAAHLAMPGAADVVWQVEQLLGELGEPSVRYPIFNLGDAAASETGGGWTAPLQADVVPGAAGPLRAILDRLWQAGIPHTRLRPAADQDPGALVDAVQHAEDLGLITGVHAPRASWLAPDAVTRLAAVGLDYVVLPWAVREPLHDALYGPGDCAALEPAIRTVQGREMTAVLSIPLTRETADAVQDELGQLLRWGVVNAEVWAVARADDEADAAPDSGLQPLAAPALRQTAAAVEDLADQHRVQVIWLPPRHCPPGTPVVETVRRGPRTGGELSIRVEPDGRVLPPRGRSTPAGNLLGDPWQKIWEHPAFARYREPDQSPERCAVCPGLAICAAACPADPASWVRDEDGGERK